MEGVQAVAETAGVVSWRGCKGEGERGEGRDTEGGELGVPGEGMAAQELAVGFCLGGDGIGAGEDEFALLWLGDFPFLRVLGRVHAEFALAFHDGLICGIVEVVGLCRSAKVELSCFNEQRVQALGLVLSC